MGDWSHCNGNFRLVSDRNIESEIVELLGKPFSFDEMWYGNVTEERYAKMPHSSEGGIEYYLSSFQIVKRNSLEDTDGNFVTDGNWLTDINISGSFRNGVSGMGIEKWLMQLLTSTKWKVFCERCDGNHNHFQYSDDVYGDYWGIGVFDGELCKAEGEYEKDFINWNTFYEWNGNEWIKKDER